jgi:hypothetical protein
MKSEEMLRHCAKQYTQCMRNKVDAEEDGMPRTIMDNMEHNLRMATFNLLEAARQYTDMEATR